jgi:hypothetical protein
MNVRRCPGCNKPMAGIESPGQFSYYDSRTLICAVCGWREANALLAARASTPGISTRSVISSPGKLSVIGRSLLERKSS